MYKKEIDMYPDIISSIAKQLDFFGYKNEIFKTWSNFGNLVKKYSNEIAILQKEALPDIIVIYVDKQGNEKCIVVEVKINNLTIKDIAQAKIYGDIFSADSVLLVSLKPIRKSFIEYSRINNGFLKCTNGAQLYTCVLSNKQLQLQNCFPNDGGFIK